ncbi:O19 family O-antigen polymerase [Escherichia coli O19:H7]|uniref:O-antigen polymerase n=1 Tax=Escherichia coli TaxID=562 RepID=A0A0B1AYH2_ECOLX|nr:O19 family O-antigen polymerase [Escherichia coli]AKM71185.1 O-antigene polymerase [Escherichia coli]EEW2381816.1 O19 family O-antigen polymerase [Escherichia coli]EFB4719556.1 O19 family O-antigen polymerase [Escherichia coli]EFH4258338.1 O19 family O-antigen polymerase [Escherichia coli]EFL4037739.1 O19 family O-antigen polymerase [Escherichia coli]
MNVVQAMVIIYLCYLIICFFFRLEITHPAVVHTIIWLISASLALVFAEEKYLPNNYYIVIANSMFFIFSFIGGIGVFNKNKAFQLNIDKNSYVNALPFCLIISFYLIILITYNVNVLSNISAFRDYLVADDGANYGLLGRIAMLSLFSSCFLLLRSRRLFLLSAVLCIPIIIILSAKTLVLLYLITILILTPNRLKISKLLIFFSIFILFFIGIMRLRYPEASFNLILYYLYNYISGGFLAFSQLPNSFNQVFGFYSFRNFYLWLNVLYPVEIANILQEWVNVPFPVNVYTYLRPYYMDFDYLSLFFPIIFGFFSGRIYMQKYKNRRIYYIVYPITFYAIAMQLFDDQYLTWLSNWILLIITGYIMTWEGVCRK